MTKIEKSPALLFAESLLCNTLRITVTDGRIFLGAFAGFDKPLNIILVNSEEYNKEAQTDPSLGGRFVGQILIPWRLVVTAEADDQITGATYASKSRTMSSIQEDVSQLYS